MSWWQSSGGVLSRLQLFTGLNGLTVVSLSLPQGTEAIKSDSESLGHLKSQTRTHL